MERIEKEITSKVFMIKDYIDNKDMEKHIKEYIRKLKAEYPKAIVTREFYKGENILIRATEVFNNRNIIQKQSVKCLEREDDWYIRQRGER